MSLTAIILAGGKSTRMGKDKAFIQWKGKSFIQHSIDAVIQLTDTILLSGDEQRLSRFRFEVVEDLEEGKGPVNGLASCFEKVKTEYALVLSCDVPQIAMQDLKYLMSEHSDNVDVTCYKYKGKSMPLIGVYNASAFPTFKNAIENGERKLFSVLGKLKVKSIEYKGVDGLMNINSPEDFKELV